ncbi:MAG: GAF domain-containing protein [Pseudomonadota bacterium]
MDEVTEDDRSVAEGARRTNAAGALAALGACPALDRVTTLARLGLRVDISLISVAVGDRLFYKSVAGAGAPFTDPEGLPIAGAPCGHVVMAERPFVVEDMSGGLDGAPALNAYFGAPLRAPGGEVLGCLCAMARSARTWTPDDLTIMHHLAGLTEEAFARALRAPGA